MLALTHIDALNDFEPVGLIVHSPMLMTSSKKLPARDLQGLVAWLRANPNKATQGTAGIAGSSHLAGILFEKMTGTRFQSVPYRGLGPATKDSIAGRIDLMFDLAANALPHVRAGSLKVHAILSKSRLGIAPDIPTVDEAGVPGLYVSSWQSIWVPKGTPKPVIYRLNAAPIVDALGTRPRPCVGGSPTSHRRFRRASSKLRRRSAPCYKSRNR